jgi:hypothetical protein
MVMDPQTLIEKFYLGCLSDEELATLNAHLLADPDLRDDFRHAAAMDSALRDAAGKVQADLDIVRRARRRRQRSVWLALAASLLLAGGAWWSQHRLHGPEIVSLEGPVFLQRGQERIAATIGMRPRPDDAVLVETRARAVLAYKREATQLELRAGSRASFSKRNGSKVVQLDQGTLLADVAQQPSDSPMRIDTPSAHATVIGTQFRIDVAEQSTRLEVSEGVVEFEKTGAPGVVRVEAEFFALADSRQVLRARPIRLISPLALDFSQPLIGAEQRASTSNEPLVRDMTHGVPAELIVTRMEGLGINLLVVPIAATDHKPLLAFVEALDRQDADTAIVLSAASIEINKEASRQAWADNLTAAFKTLADAGLAHRVKGCQLRTRSTARGKFPDSDWSQHIDHVVDLMQGLNSQTDAAFAARSLLLPGRRAGADFSGIAEAFHSQELDSRLLTQCASFAFTFDNTHVAAPADTSIASWGQYLRAEVGLAEFAGLGESLIFVGKAGGFAPGPTGAWESEYQALNALFRENEWQHFAFSSLLYKACKCATAKSVLHTAISGRMEARKHALESWSAWKANFDASND